MEDAKRCAKTDKYAGEYFHFLCCTSPQRVGAMQLPGRVLLHGTRQGSTVERDGTRQEKPRIPLVVASEQREGRSTSSGRV